MSFDPNQKGQGWIEYLLVFILAALVIWILYTLLGPAISSWIRGFLAGL